MRIQEGKDAPNHLLVVLDGFSIDVELADLLKIDRDRLGPGRVRFEAHDLKAVPAVLRIISDEDKVELGPVFLKG